jgi:hypothetical protein
MDTFERIGGAFMRIGFSVVAMVAMVAACNNSSAGGGSASASGSGASTSDCVNKMMSWNPGSGDAEKKLFDSMCSSITADQRTCIVKAKTDAEGKKCLPGKP